MDLDERDERRLWVAVLLASAAAWGAMLLPAAGSHHHHHGAAPTSHHLRDGASSGVLDVLGGVAWGSEAVGWLLMLVAMMAPTTAWALLHIRSTTRARLRWSASALFLVGYGAVWMLAGVPMVAAETLLAWAVPGSLAPALVIGLVAVLWQASPFKQRCLNRCHRHTPLSAFGWQAHRDALGMGLSHGVWCVGSCWVAMLLPMVLPIGHMAAMAAVTLLMVCERLDPPEVPRWRLRGFGTALAAVRLRVWGPTVSPAPFLGPTEP
jgi:predicted metal-binding membrane protein